MAHRKLAKQVSDKATVYWDAEWQEYIVKLKGNPNADYYTDDKADAYGTAKEMDKE